MVYRPGSPLPADPFPGRISPAGYDRDEAIPGGDPFDDVDRGAAAETAVCRRRRESDSAAGGRFPPLPVEIRSNGGRFRNVERGGEVEVAAGLDEGRFCQRGRPDR